MKVTLRDLLIQCSSSKNLDPSRYPSQILCLSEQIRFTEQCEEAIARDTLGALESELKEQLESYTSAEPESLVLQLKLKALILDLIHHIDIIEQLKTANCSTTESWAWQKQLR